MIHDLEVENHQSNRRFCNPWDERNYVVARGWKYQSDVQCSYTYHTSKSDDNYIDIPDDIGLIVGHNIKFDLMYDWDDETLKNFFNRGGKIWDTQYAEYLLMGAREEFHMIAMDTICEKYGGRKKIDAVKQMWEDGYLTSQIDKDMLIDYLIGTEEEGRNSGDIGNTELIFLGQIKLAVQYGMLPMIQARMDGLLATTEMEFNGLKIDIAEAKRKMDLLNAELVVTDAELIQYIPELPEGLEFNWNSNVHVSALIFGGAVKYIVTDTYLDEKTGELARKWETKQEQVGTYTSGKRKGEPKFQTIKFLGELKTKKQERHFEFNGYTSPDKKWITASIDALGNPVYSTAADTITELGSRNIPFLKLLSKRQDITKDLGTYYVKWDDKKKEYTGMLACVDKNTKLIHHSLNHVNTVTTRLSSNNPNLQNIPTEGTSEVKKMFVSRFNAGKMLELDYKQLEIVVQALESNDKQMIQDLLNKVDFHCKRVSVLKKVDYETALYRCTNETYENYKEWHRYRTKAKVFSFQRAYGAGAAKIADSTGMEIDEVKDMIEAEEALYPGLVGFNVGVDKHVQANAVPFRDPIRGFRTFRKGTWQSKTGTIYSFRSYDAPAFLKKRGIEDSFKPTELKNYPIQGGGGEYVQIALGRLWRHFISKDNYNGQALLCNTVHDCVWIDVQGCIVMQVAKEAKAILEGIPAYLKELYGIDSPVPFPVEAEVGDNLFNKEPIHV